MYRKVLLITVLGVFVLGAIPLHASRASREQAKLAAKKAKDQALSPKERKALIAGLPAFYREFLEEVAPIVSEEEVDEFLRIEEDVLRDEFVRRFWELRSNSKNGRYGDFRSVYMSRRSDFAAEFPREKITGELAKTYLLLGPPDGGMQKISCEDYFSGVMIWWYTSLSQVDSRDGVPFIFYKPGNMGTYHLWRPSEGISALVNPMGGFTTMGGAPSPFEEKRIEDVYEKCQDKIYDLTRAAQIITAVFHGSPNFPLLADVELEKVFTPPTVSQEDVKRVRKECGTRLDEKGEKFPIDTIAVSKLISMQIPDASGARQLRKVQVNLPVPAPREAFVDKDIGGKKFFNVRMIGYVERDVRLSFCFSYDFLFRSDEVTDILPLMGAVTLPPGEYTVALKVVDLNGKAQGRFQDVVVVPSAESVEKKQEAAKALASPPLLPHGPETVPSAPPAALEDATPVVAVDPKSSVTREERKIVFLPLGEEMTSGEEDFAVKTSPECVRVDFSLDDGSPIIRNTPPFAIQLNPNFVNRRERGSTGNTPQRHKLAAVCYGDKDGKVNLGRDEMYLNQGPNTFRVHLVAPSNGSRVSGTVPVYALVSTPPDEKVGKVDVYVGEGESPVRTLTAPPWLTDVEINSPVNIPVPIRVQATLDDGTAVEDLSWVNGDVEKVEVNAAQLFVSVWDKEKKSFVDGLTAKDFTVTEDDTPQQLDSVEYVRNLPVRVGVVVDTSYSMTEAINTTLKAADEFIGATLQSPKDKAFIMGIGSSPYSVTNFKSDKDELTFALARLSARGGTALYQGIVSALYKFQGVRGPKALVLLTDGQDCSKELIPASYCPRSYAFTDVREYARRAGVQIYAIGLGKDASGRYGVTDEVNRELRELAEETAGKAYFIGSADEDLAKAYQSASEELRSRYVLTYYPSSSKLGWHNVSVRANNPKWVIRAVRGYYFE